MRISYNWLKEYVDMKLPVEKLAETLTMAGLAVESIRKIGDDSILEIEVTSNRADCLSVIGVAREVAALTGKKLSIPPPVKLGTGSKEQRVGEKVSIKVEDKKLCPRYTARIIHNVKVGESPTWLKNRIEAMNLRPVNNIVDITNLCLFETGEPMHAFDLDKISERVIIRRSGSGEKITVIDGSEKILDGSQLVIADNTRPIAIAGVMGALNTEVTYSTENILLEAAYFDPVSIRRTAKSLGISTESSYRFERKVDVENIKYASDRAAGLMLELAGGQIGELLDIGKGPGAKKEVDFRYSRCNAILGEEIPPSVSKKILNSLGIKIVKSQKDKAKLRIPSFRNDLSGEIDIIEEVARIYGYDKIPVTIPNIVEEGSRISSDMAIGKLIRQNLASLGLDEIMTYSLLSKKLLDMALLSDKDTIEMKNPLNSEQEMMRPSLIPGMLLSLVWNMNRRTKDLGLFELGNIYIKNSEGKFIERKSMCIGMAGQAYSSWAGGSRQSDFFSLKGIVETLFSELGIESASFKHAKNSAFASSSCAAIEISGEAVGMLGEVNKRVLANFDIKEKVYAAEIDVNSLSKHISPKKRFKEMPKYPSSSRDISIVVSGGILNADIVLLMRETAGAILKEIKLIDRYAGKQIPEGKTGLTYRLEYQDPGKTLEDRDIQSVHAAIIHRLEEKFSARLR